MNRKKKICRAIGIVAITAVGIIVIPPIIEELTNRFYKCSVKNEIVDYDNMGPEIIKKENIDEEDNAE